VTLGTHTLMYFSTTRMILALLTSTHNVEPGVSIFAGIYLGPESALDGVHAG